MGRYLTEKQVVEKYNEGWRIEVKTNYKNKPMSYWMWKKGEKDLLFFTVKTRESLRLKNIIDSNNDLVNRA